MDKICKKMSDKKTNLTYGIFLFIYFFIFPSDMAEKPLSGFVDKEYSECCLMNLDLTCIWISFHINADGMSSMNRQFVPHANFGKDVEPLLLIKCLSVKGLGTFQYKWLHILCMTFIMTTVWEPLRYPRYPLFYTT